LAGTEPGYPNPIGGISRKLEIGRVNEMPALAGLFGFFNQFRLLGQDYALAQL